MLHHSTPRMRLSDVACKKIAWCAEGNRLVVYLALLAGVLGLAFLITQYFAAIVLLGFCGALAYAFLPKLYKVTLKDMMADSHDKLRQQMVEHQAITEEKRKHDGYEAKADEVIDILEQETGTQPA